MSEKTDNKKTPVPTPAPARQEAVAEPLPDAGPSGAVAQEENAPPSSGKGFCDNHPDVPAEVITDFPWSVEQRFCSRCVPAHYRALL